MLDTIKKNPRGRKPKAYNLRTLPNLYIIRTQRLLSQYGFMTFEEFAVAYLCHFRDNLDVLNLGFDDGYLGFFQQLDHMVSLYEYEENIICSLNKATFHPELLFMKASRSHAEVNPKSYGSLIPKVDRNHEPCGFFSPDNTILWGPKFAHLLKCDPKNISISMSPLELAINRNLARVKNEISMIRKALARFPQGIALNQLYTVVNIDKRLFNAPSIATIVEECPELFYISRIKSDGEPVVYDGFEHTYQDLSGATIPKTKSGPRRSSYTAIASGLYQKTILLVRKAGAEGLKLAVWLQSMRESFPGDFDLHDVHPLSFFLCLKNVGLIDIRSHKKCKNDLRIYLPNANFVDNFIELAQGLRAERAILKELKSLRK